MFPEKPGTKPWGQALGLRVAVRPAAAGIGSRQRLVHDPPDGPRAAATLGAAAEATIDFAAGARRTVTGERRAHVLVGQHVAGADDHCGTVPADWSRM